LKTSQINITLSAYSYQRGLQCYRNAIEARFRAIFELELSGDLDKSALGWLGAHVTQKYFADYLIDAMEALS